MKKYLSRSFAPLSLLAFLSIFCSLTDRAAAQQQPVGVTTGVQGQAQLSRPGVPKPSLLRFRDDVILRDVVDTRERSLARILFGGRSTVTVRELTRLEVREELLPTGARRDVHDLSSGAILVNVARQLMKPGDEVQIRTPNAVAAVRGSSVFSAYGPPFALPGQSFFAFLAGSGILTPEGLPPITLTANTPNNGANVSGAGPDVQANVVTVTAAQAAQIVQESQVGKAVTEEAAKEQVLEAAAKEAAALATAVVEAATTDETTATTTEGTEGTTTTETTTESTTAPVQSDTSSGGGGGCSGGGNIVKNCGFETTGSIPDWDLTGAGSSITQIAESNGTIHFQPTEGKRMAIIHTGTGAVNNTTSTLSQSTTQLQAGKTFLITFDYLFMSNEFPTQSTTFNDKFTAIGKDIIAGTEITIAEESRNSSTFKTDKPSISGGGFTLSSGNGYVDCGGDCAKDASGNLTAFKKASKTVQPDSNSGTLEFKIIDVGDTVVDSAVLIDNVVVKLDPPLYEVFNGQSLTGPHQNPLVEYSDQSTTFDSVLAASGSGPDGSPSVSLSGPLLKAERSDLDVPFSLLAMTYNSRLVSTSSDPLVWLNGGNYDLSTEIGTAIFDFWGTKTAVDPETGVEVGTSKSVDHAGSLLEASGGATVNTQKVLKLDTALLEATAPIINLIGSPNKETSLTTQQSTIDLIKAKVVSNGPVVALDKSLINVTNGALINLTHGSYMNVKGDLLSLTNGSKINVVNGPLISVAGLGSTLDVSGALANFGGSGGNKIIVKNNIAPTATLNGLPVSATLGGTVNVGGTAVKNPDLGTISVTGSLISANNNGKVNIQGK